MSPAAEAVGVFALAAKAVTATQDRIPAAADVLLFIQDERDETVAGRGDHVLLTIELIGDRAVRDATNAGIPQRCSGGRIVRPEAGRGGTEDDVAGPGVEDRVVRARAVDGAGDVRQRRLRTRRRRGSCAGAGP